MYDMIEKHENGQKYRTEGMSFEKGGSDRGRRGGDDGGGGSGGIWGSGYAV